MQPDENDIIYTAYGVDFNAILKSLYELIFGGSFTYDAFVQFLLQLWTVYSVIAFIVSIIFIIGIIYCYLKINQLDEIIEDKLDEQKKNWEALHHGNIEDKRWHSVQIHLESTNPNDWKLAIIEADVLLERLLETAGYVGVTIGDKLKSASTRSFKTLDEAWQAHRIRNQIAHGGADFVLTHKIAKDTLILYERVFKEFDFL